MTRRLTVLAALLAAASAAQIRIDRIRADIGFLSSDALEGRKALDRGSDAAAEFIAAEFAKAGLVPANGASYLQPFTLLAYRSGPRRLVLRRAGSARECEYGKEFSGGFPAEISVSGPVVFAGYGITAPEYGYDDYAGLDVRGKVVFLFDHEPQETDPKSIFNGLGNTVHASPQMKILNAQRHGAVAVLAVAEPNRKHPSAMERMARVPGGRARAASPLAQALAGSDHRIPMFTVSDALAAELLAPTGKTPAELQAGIDSTLRPASRLLPDTAVEMQVALEEWRRGTTFNVAGVLEGADPKLKHETVLFTSHYDHLGMRGGQVSHGADDNASGTAGVIELARAFASGQRPRRTLVFLSFGAEEAGLLGSYYYTDHPLRPLDTTRAVINLDMIGRDEAPSKQTEGLIRIAEDTSNETNLIGTKESPEFHALIERENRAIGLRLNPKWDDDTALSILWRCDHFPFLLKRVPAIWFFNGFTPDYHQPTDTLEKLDFTKMEKIVRLAYLTGRALGEGAPAPRYRP